MHRISTCEGSVEIHADMSSRAPSSRTGRSIPLFPLVSHRAISFRRSMARRPTSPVHPSYPPGSASPNTADVAAAGAKASPAPSYGSAATVLSSPDCAFVDTRPSRRCFDWKSPPPPPPPPLPPGGGGTAVGTTPTRAWNVRRTADPWASSAPFAMSARADRRRRRRRPSSSSSSSSSLFGSTTSRGAAVEDRTTDDDDPPRRRLRRRRMHAAAVRPLTPPAQTAARGRTR